MAELGDKAREEFFSEAQELIETLSRSLLELDENNRAGTEDPSVVNGAFRAVHTLKSLAGIFGTQAIAVLSHRLEDVLDSMRLGKVEVSPALLDVLFQAVEIYWQQLAHERDARAPTPSTDTLMESLRLLGAPEAAAGLADEFDFDPALLSVLTEYEEHRLRSSVKQGLSLFRIRVAFELTTIDKDLEAIKLKAKPLGEVITYLPTGESASADVIELDLLLASGHAIEQLTTELAGDKVHIESVPRRNETSVPAPSNAVVTSIQPPSGDQITVHPPPMIDASDSGSLAPGTVMRSVSQTVRVDIRRLDSLMNAVGELAIVRGAMARLGERVRHEGQARLGTDMSRLNRDFERRLRELQEGILEVRMVPLSQVFDRLTRVVRQIGRDLGKEIRLVVTGGETEIDKVLVEELSDPLMHIVRNAIDHGIESSSQRERIGKPVAGTIVLNAFQKGNHVVLEVEDDGGGINPFSLTERAVELGVMTSSEAGGLNRAEALNLVFLPGLSTRQQADEHSGRGVGMDVVKTNIGKLGGVIDLHSEVDIGTRITVTLPITLAIVNALLIRCAGRIFAVPLSNVSEALALDPASVKWVDQVEVWTRRGASLPLCRVKKLFELSEEKQKPDGVASGARPLRRGRHGFVVVVVAGARRIGLVVDELLGQEDIVIKALGASLNQVRGFAGASELGDQGVALVVDVASVIDEMLSTTEVRLVREREERV